jgi:Zn-dependent peptidase ImmA (M78 family)
MQSKLSESIIAKQEAVRFRRIHGLSTSESLNLESLLLQLNVLTVYLPLKKVSGMAVKIEKNNIVHRFILINSNDSIGRQNFTICHELYHLFIQKDFSFQLCNTGLYDKKNIEEYRADLFASAFLIPDDGVNDFLLQENFDIQNKTLLYSSILKLEHYFGCSRAAMLNKLVSLGYNDLKKGTSLHTELTTNIKIQAQQYGYSLNLYNLGNHKKVIGDYGEMSKKMFDSEKISESHYSELMEHIFVNIYTPQLDESETD